MDETKLQEIEEAHQHNKQQRKFKLDKVEDKFEKLIEKTPEKEEELKAKLAEEREKIISEFTKCEKFEIDSIQEKYLFTKQKTEEIIDQNNVSDSLSHSK